MGSNSGRSYDKSMSIAFKGAANALEKARIYGQAHKLPAKELAVLTKAEAILRRLAATANAADERKRIAEKVHAKREAEIYARLKQAFDALNPTLEDKLALVIATGNFAPTAADMTGADAAFNARYFHTNTVPASLRDAAWRLTRPGEQTVEQFMQRFIERRDGIVAGMGPVLEGLRKAKLAQLRPDRADGTSAQKNPATK